MLKPDPPPIPDAAVPPTLAKSVRVKPGESIEASVTALEGVTESLTNPDALSLPVVRGLIARLAESAQSLGGKQHT